MCNLDESIPLLRFPSSFRIQAAVHDTALVPAAGTHGAGAPASSGIIASPTPVVSTAAALPIAGSLPLPVAPIASPSAAPAASASSPAEVTSPHDVIIAKASLPAAPPSHQGASLFAALHGFPPPSHGTPGLTLPSTVVSPELLQPLPLQAYIALDVKARAEAVLANASRSKSIAVDAPPIAAPKAKPAPKSGGSFSRDPVDFMLSQPWMRVFDEYVDPVTSESSNTSQNSGDSDLDEPPSPIFDIGFMCACVSSEL